MKKTFSLLLTVLLILAMLPMNVFAVSDDTAYPVSTAATAAKKNETMMQYFEWYLPADGQFWNQMKADAVNLKEAGITGLWIPPFYKAVKQDDVGYGAYDLWDLGEFDQKGTVRTKYGTKDELIAAIKSVKSQGIKVYGDVVLNHKGGADAFEQTNVDRVDYKNRNQKVEGPMTISAPTSFVYAGRGDKYSTFKWKNVHFTGVDQEKGTKIFRINGPGKGWNWEVDTENGNYDFLLYSDVDLQNQEVIDEYRKWGKWVVETLDLDGFRLDAAKHMRFEFTKDWLTNVRKDTGRDLFSVGEYLSGNSDLLNNYLNKTGYTTHVFDVALHYHFYDLIKENGGYDMQRLLSGTMMERNPKYTVTYVDSHDSQPGQLLESWIPNWFKPQAYALILTRDAGIPCVFYGDYYGIPKNNIAGMKKELDPLLKARADFAYGKQNDYIDNADVIGWTREGNSDHPNSGLATLISDGSSGTKTMMVGAHNAGEVWEDITGNVTEKVTIGADGKATFRVNSKSVSVYVNKSGSKSTSNVQPPTPMGPVEVTHADTDFVVYYKKGMSNPYIHYSVKTGVWTKAPGMQMVDSEFDGYAKAVIPSEGSDKLTFVFTDSGMTRWEKDTAGKDLVATAVGGWTYDAGKLTQMYPGPTATPKPKVTETPSPTPVATETPAPTEAPVETVAPTPVPTEVVPVETPVVPMKPTVITKPLVSTMPVEPQPTAPPSGGENEYLPPQQKGVAHVFVAAKTQQMSMIVYRQVNTKSIRTKLEMKKSIIPGYYYIKVITSDIGAEVTFTDNRKFVDTNKGKRYVIKPGVNVVSNSKLTILSN